MEKIKTIEIKATYLGNGQITDLVHSIREIQSKNKKVKLKLKLDCLYCKNKYKTTKFDLSIVDARLFGVVPRLNHGDGMIKSICTNCGVENTHGNYCGQSM